MDGAAEAVFVEGRSGHYRSTKCHDACFNSWREETASGTPSGLLDAIVGGLRELPTLELAALPRMADFARFGEAIGRGLGWPAEAFLSVYAENRQAASVLALEDSPIAQQLLFRASMYAVCRGWTLPAAKMLQQLTAEQATLDACGGPLAEIASRAHQRAATACSDPAHKRNYRQIQQNPRSSTDHDQRRAHF